MELRLKALEIAQSQVGQSENPKGSNWGKPVQDYLASVGITFPAAWCCAFVYWCYTEASKQLVSPNPMHKTGGVIDCWNKSANKLLRSKATASNVLSGYQFCMDFGGGKGHTGFVESVDTDGTIHTIEGNSNTDGSREGTEVVRHTRHLSDKALLGFIKY